MLVAENELFVEIIVVSLKYCACVGKWMVAWKVVLWVVRRGALLADERVVKKDVERAAHLVALMVALLVAPKVDPTAVMKVGSLVALQAVWKAETRVVL